MPRARRVRAVHVLPPETPATGAGAGPGAATLQIPATAALDAFDGLALVFDGAGQCIEASAAARPLAEALACEGQLAALAAATRAEGAHGRQVTTADGRVFDLALFPLVGEGVFALARDLTLERNLHNALVESRSRYKDIVACSSDFAWETGADGRFVFVSPRGALGYTATELVGRHPREFIALERQDPAAALPFEGHEPQDGAIVWLRRADGAPACLLTSSVPRRDEGGFWQGARGVCRDITEARARDEALARARARERLLARIVDSIREEVDPERLLGRAAEATGRALDADLCRIFRRGAGGVYECAARYGLAGDKGPIGFLASELPTLADTEGPVEMPIAGFHLLAALSRHHGRANGAVAIGRRAGREGWGDDERALLGAVAEHLGIAIEQIANHERLKRLSRTDALTGLLNRRAFTEELANRYHMARRSGRPAAVLYVDLDNFKSVNDVHGHKQGDAVLKGWAAALSRYSRAGDVIARLGGDEFAVWLEDTDEAGARAKANSVLQAASALERYSGDPDRPLGASIGIAVFDPASDETLDALVARADAAMYEAKRGGKGTIAVAPPPGNDERGAG